MLSGSSLTKFQDKFPNRCFDAGITEQHAVTFAAGLAADCMKPIVHLYSTFAQRAFDQIVHDVALQNLPVVFALDRAGLVGEDGATHHGAFDLSFLNPIPNLQVLAPMNAAELRGMLEYAFGQRGAVVIRFPRGGEENATFEERKIEKASFEVLQKGEKTTIVSLGTIGQEVAKAVKDLPEVGHINLRFLKPWNDAALKEALIHSTTIITAEEGSMRGGLRDSFAAWASEHLPSARVKGIGLPDQFVAHATPEQLAADFGLDAEGIKKFILKTQP
jgi:1-deoxy-D-xylulose-5-phosphate synthase